MKSFAETIRDSRIAEGLTVRDLERRVQLETGVQVSDTLISFIENEVRAPTYDTGIPIAESLGFGRNEAVRMTFLARLDWFLEKEKNAIREIEKKHSDSDEINDAIDSARVKFHRHLAE